MIFLFSVFDEDLVFVLLFLKLNNLVLVLLVLLVFFEEINI